MKPSNYNFIIPFQEDKALLYNSKTNALMEVEQRIIDNLQGSKENLTALSVKEQEELISHGYLTENLKVEKDETIAFDKQRQESLGNQQHILSLTIMPTIACNCQCFYCFEPSMNIQKQGMSEMVQDQIITYVSKKVEDGSIKKVKIVWYGGEPLLYPKIILRIQNSIFKVCKKNNVELTGDIVTNGLLLDYTLTKKLVDCNINRCQITFDGPEKIHNKRRYSPKDSDQNYKKLIDLLKTSYEGMDFSLRVNVDRDNKDTIYELVHDFIDNKIWPYKKNIKNIYLGHLAEGVNSNKINCLTRKEFLTLEEEFRYWLLEQYNQFNDKKKAKLRFQYPSHTNVYCSFGIDSNTWVVDALGKLYKCWEAVGMDDQVIGTIQDLLHDKEQIKTKMASWKIKEEDREKWGCYNCKFLPICGTKCPFDFIPDNHNNERRCTDWKINLNEKLTSQYQFYLNNPQMVKGFPK